MPVLPSSARRRLMSVHVGYTVTDNTVPNSHSGAPPLRLAQSYTDWVSIAKKEFLDLCERQEKYNFYHGQPLIVLAGLR